jgi:diguanylate cyclase (GGDEF)-like protein
MTPIPRSESYELLMEFLHEESAHRKFPGQLWQRMEAAFGEDLHTTLLHALTQIQFDPIEAEYHWQGISEHRRRLKKRLQRDPGLQVATADYFVNIHKNLSNPIIIEFSVYLKQEDRALRDELTDLYNRRFLRRILKQEIERARRFNETLSVLMIDVDHFKSINDEYGHGVGDDVLMEVAKTITLVCRKIDHVTRYGGEEFVVVLPRAGRSEALIAAERQREAIESHLFTGLTDRSVTVSIGAATFPDDAADRDTLLSKADEALYDAKNGGRNQVCGHRDQRRHIRYPIETDITFSDKELHVIHASGKTKNISLGGLLSEANQKIPVGARLNCHLPGSAHLPDINIDGLCVRVGHPEVESSAFCLGVRFDLDSPSKQKAVRLFLENHAHMACDPSHL